MRIALIGEGALALRCFQALYARGLKPALMCSPDGSLAALAGREGVVHAQQRGKWSSLLAVDACDVLFSVRNPWILSSSDLACVRRSAYNFHDSLLPSYAGLHATSWALIHGEQTHGITWHEIVSGLDMGRIVVQVPLTVVPEDTAFTLNTRCFDAAVSAFEYLLDALVGDRLNPVPQEGPRSYFGARARPPSQGVIDFHASASSVVNLVRALDFGIAPNPLGLPKVWLGDETVVVKCARALAVHSGASPGTLVKVDTTKMQIATSDSDVELSGLFHMNGQAVDGSVWLERVANRSGTVLPHFSEVGRAQVSSLIERVCLQEQHWADCLGGGVVPACHPGVSLAETATWRGAALVLANAAMKELPRELRLKRALAVLALYAARLGRDTAIDIGLVRTEAMDLEEPLFATVVPWRVDYDSAQRFDAFESQVYGSFERTVAMDTFALDLIARTPALRGNSVLPRRWPFALVVGDEMPPQVRCYAALVVWISSDGSHIQLFTGVDKHDKVLVAIEARLATLIRSCGATSGAPVARLELLDSVERERLLVTWNATSTPFPAVCMHELFQNQVRKTPDAPAVSFGAEVLTYSELDAKANQLAHALISNEVVPGDLVALSVTRSLQVLVGMLGIMKTGAAYVPIDADYPRERIETMLQQCQPRVLVTHALTRDSLSFYKGFSFCLDGCGQMLEAMPRVAPSVSMSPQRRVYCIFTSGSTGTPKCVEICHRSLVNHALAIRKNYGLGAKDRILCSASISFDVAAEQIYPALLSGAEVVVRPDDLFESLERIDHFIRDRQLTALILPTALWHEWVRFLEVRRLLVPPALRVLSVGTEKALGVHLASWLVQGGGGVQFFQGYGPTEATVTCTMYVHVAGSLLDPVLPLPIGRPLPNTEIYLLDDSGEPVPIGVEGEIYVGGVGLARGYLGRPDLTEQLFVSHPFSPDPEARLYKTGDIARFEPEGQLVYVGRADFQVKVRGFRVELSEIESVLRLHPAVNECVVMLREDSPETKRLVAYVVASDTAIDSMSLERVCRERLPEYMVPLAFVVLPEFPININGKIDRRALPVPRQASSFDVTGAVTQYQDDVEVIVAKAFAQALGLPHVSLVESFFEMGGDSLTAMGLLVELASALSSSLTLSDLFDAPSVMQLAARVRAGSRGDAPLILQMREGSGIPVWLVAGILHYEPLARALPGDSPVYVVLLPAEVALLSEGAFLPPIKVLAERYIEHIRRHTPEGPYVIGGFSFGGAVAYEVAQSLVQQGQDVRLLVLFDTVLPSAFVHGVKGWLMRQKNAFAILGVGELWRRCKALFISTISSEEVAEQRSAEAVKLEERRLAGFARVLREFEESMKPYDGTVVLYRSRGQDVFQSVTHDHGFAGFVRGDWHIQEVAGRHLAMMSVGHVDVIAQDLASRIAASGSCALSVGDTRLETRNVARVTV